ncbi:MAG: helix-turn-helix transcriptional regulator [Candidatus Lindowbacteria bacterium]|nr:helix-turn-helix transcriptional regulator [Candidatus Lindowbacteria bacterium]
MIKEFLRGSIRVHVLYHASKQPIYGVEMLKELRRHGYRLSPGTLYPLLHDMENQRLLVCKTEIVRGKIRKYYVATGKGRRALKQAQRKISELVKEVLEEEK